MHGSEAQERSDLKTKFGNHQDINGETLELSEIIQGEQSDPRIELQRKAVVREQAEKDVFLKHTGKDEPEGEEENKVNAESSMAEKCFKKEKVINSQIQWRCQIK